MSIARAQYERFVQLVYEFAKFGVIGVAGLFITNAVYELLFLHLGAGPTSPIGRLSVPHRGLHRPQPQRDN